MPELPEVETIKLGLEAKIKGLKIEKIQILTAKSFSGAIASITGAKISTVARRAKLLLIGLDNNKTIIIHLKMTGQLILEASSQQQGARIIGGHPTTNMFSVLPNSTTRAVFNLSDGSKLFFNDQRMFGWIKVVNNDQLPIINQKLGPEPLGEEFSWTLLKTQLLKRKTTPVKVVLMGQEIVAGIGNIYASEACFIAGLDPRRKVLTITDGDFQRLHQGVIQSLTESLKQGGSTRSHFKNINGERGNFLEHAFVYGKNGQPCKVCAVDVEKVTLGGRGTYLCSQCQK